MYSRLGPISASRNNRQTAFFDVPLHDNFYRASKGPFDLRRILDNTLLKVRPYDAVTFVDNHE
jgi:alpha-amylase